MIYSFPYDPTGGSPLTMEGILRGVASANAGQPVLVVSTSNSITTTAISANQQLSAVLLGGTAFVGDVSALSPDASLFRVSAIGGTTGDHTLVDGTTQTISATLTPISASPAGTVQGLVTNAFQQDAGKFLTSAKQGDAGLLHVSALIFDGEYSAAPNVIVSATATPATSSMKSIVVTAVSLSAGTMLVSAKSQDANQVHVSAVQGDAGLFHVSGFAAAANFGVSAAQTDAGALHTSAFVDSGSVSAKSGDANNLHTSAVQGDAGLLRVSGWTLPTTNTGGASFFYSSAISGQTSANVKTTAGRLYGYHLYNPAGVDQYLQIFNVSGLPTLGTDVPALSLPVPTLGGAVMSLGPGIAFSTGIVIFATSTAAGNSIAASALRVNIFYA